MRVESVSITIKLNDMDYNNFQNGSEQERAKHDILFLEKKYHIQFTDLYKFLNKRT